MNFFRKAAPFYRRNTFIIVSTLIVLMITVRVLLPSVVLKELNSFLATFSPVYSLHLTDVDLSIIRGAYRLEGVEGRLKKDQTKFLSIDDIEVSLAWRELFKGRVLTDIIATGVDFHYLAALKDNTPKNAGEDAKKAKEKVFPVKVSRLDLRESKITVDDYPEIEPGKKLYASNLSGRITNLTPDKKDPLSFYNFKATLLDSAVLKTTGKLNLTTTPAQWDLDSELQGFDMRKLNAFLYRHLPLTFTKGHLDLYAEIVSQNGKMDGYVKPFIKDLDVVKTQEDFKGPKHWFFEILSAGANLILRTSDSKTVASKIPFRYDHGLKMETGTAVSNAIKNGFEQQLSPGIENSLEIK